MAMLEDRYIYRDVDFTLHCTAWWRYIDNVFVLWQGYVESLLWFCTKLNDVHPSITFSLTYDTQSIHFLDVLIYKGIDGRLCTSLYSKPTDHNQILHYKSQHPPHTKSQHPPHTKNSIPITQLSSEEVDTKQIYTFCNTILNKQSIGNILRKHWHILKNAYPNIQEFKTTPLVSYRRGRTIGTSVTSSNLKTKNPTTNTFLGGKSTGMYPCLCCNQCPFVSKGKEFVHPQTGKRVKLRGYYTCTTKFAIYILTCETTQKVKSCISQHRSSINLGNMTLPVSKHILEKGHT
ncbi:hypothetical protein XELAEV_18006786mg [Xenopus laevis]|uniref:Uncharacterized protein n=1 Tax=Xenopus laevis TaxID=8355 RepID=A0A974DZA0_XENLA|nr:hypothetical protein XELAEV_18006786mg [Xenopus laevis]